MNGLQSWTAYNAVRNPARARPLDVYRRAYPRIVQLWDVAGGTRPMSRDAIQIRRAQGEYVRTFGVDCAVVRILGAHMRDHVNTI